MADTLQGLREKIDALDEKVVGLLNERARLAQAIGALKHGKAVYRPEREAQVLRRVRDLNPGPLPGEALTRVYTEVMSACRALEDGMTVAYLGPEGTFSEEATVKHFGGGSLTLPCASIDEVFRKVETGAAGYGVVPVENSTEGAVGLTLDLLLQTQLAICGEVMLPVHQCLMHRTGRMDGVQRIYSHTQSLAQCRGWLTANYPSVERIAVVSNAEAARLASLDETSAAVAGRMAAQRYGLALVAENIEDVTRNTTRFVVLAKQDAGPSGCDKTSLILSTRNQPGAIHELLTPLASHRVSMTRLESRPARVGLWEYVFFIDIEGHRTDGNVAHALAEMQERASSVKVLGSYPRAGV
jgi:chorismate mutase/prephenate dehydratase